MRQEKELLLNELKEQIEGSGAFVLIRYQNMSAVATEQFRDSVAEAGAQYEVVSKRVFLKSARASGIEHFSREMLQGHIGVVFAKDDPVPMTKAVCKYQADSKDLVEVLCGQFDGKMMAATDIEKLSKLPGKDQMRAQFLATLAAPMSQTLAVMQALLTSVIYCIDNKVKKESDQK